MSFQSFECHSIIPMSFQSFECHSIIPMSFHHSNFIPPFQCHSSHLNVIPVIWMSFHHSSVIPSILVHDDNILSFGVNPFIPWSFEHWNDVKWHSFEMTGMMLEWRFRSFPAHSPHPRHPRHPRLLGKMGPFLISSLSFRTIPVIRVSFGNSQPMWISSNDVGMTEDFELKWTSFPKIWTSRTFNGLRPQALIKQSRPTLWGEDLYLGSF